MGRAAQLVDDRGSGTVLAVGISAAVLLLTAALLALAAALGQAQKASAAADAAALAAADALAGFSAQYPCDAAGIAAVLNGATVQECRVEGTEAHVTVAVTIVGFVYAVSARAGPPQG